MVFSSLEFLFLYLPLTLAVYFIVPFRIRNAVLLLTSLAFYGWGEPLYVFLMIFTIAADYAFGLMINKFRADKKLSRGVLILAIIVNLAILGYFKYSDFIIENLSRIPFFSHLEPQGISLPIGISFYTFQALSYVIDVYRLDARVQKNPINFGTYVTLFPQLIAGPIVRYSDIDSQLDNRRHSLTMAVSGVRTFCAGLAKKVLIGNTAGALWAAVRDLPPQNRSAALAWAGILCFTAQIYFDFSGYSDMAVGLGKILGFRFPENFYYPYVSLSVTDFWRRWHITLSSWFREYVYIPLGGNRGGRLRTYLNLLAVWTLTGLWHGASWNFVLWGLYYFVLLLIEKAFLLRFLNKLPKILSWLYTMLTVVFGWLLFVFDGSLPTLGTSNGIIYLKNMFGIGSGFFSSSDIYLFFRNFIPVLIMIIAATPYPRRMFYSLCKKSRIAEPLGAVACVLGMIVCTSYLVSSSYNPFLYFRF